MAKFELPLFNAATGEREKILQRDFMPVNLYVRFQKFTEGLSVEETESDEAMFNALKPLFLELFPEMTEEEYLNQVDIGDVIYMLNFILEKSSRIKSGGDSKNG